jgi:hypothetical protein
MKHNTNNSPTVVTRWTRFLGAMVILALIVSAVAVSQVAPPLGTAANFGVLAQAGITGASVVTRNVGTLSGTIDVTVTAPGYLVYPVNDPVVQTAMANLLTAYNNAAGQAITNTPGGGLLSGTLGPGVYSLSAPVSNLLTTVTLNGTASDVWIFNASSTLITSSSSSVILTGGAVWNNVFWVVGSSATLGANSTFKGTILANTTITVGSGVTVIGRMLAGAVTITGVVTLASNVLPVELVSFTATANRTSANLHWSTATETNNYGFEIERRQTATWAKIGFVAGAGSSSSPREYTYNDNNLSEGSYAYRIKQVNKDGSFSYHGSAQVEIGSVAKKFELASNFPNPFNPSTTVQFTLENDGVATLTVYNLLGQEVMTLFNDNAQAGKLYQVKFDASRLPTGLYFAKLQSGNQRMMQKMALVK